MRADEWRRRGSGKFLVRWHTNPGNEFESFKELMDFMKANRWLGLTRIPLVLWLFAFVSMASAAQTPPESVLKSYFDALRQGNRAAASGLTARFPKFTDAEVASATDSAVSMAKNGRWSPVISKSKVIGNCAVVVFYESPTDPDPAYLMEQNGAWRVLPKVTQYKRDTFEFPKGTLEKFQELEQWYEGQVGKSGKAARGPFDEDVITKSTALAGYLDRGFDVNARSADDGKDTLLMRAVRRRADDSVKLLLERGAKVDERTMTLQKTALFWAAFEGTEASAKLLLEKGADPNALDLLGNNALREAAAARRAGMVRLLLQHGTKLDQVNKDGESMKDIALKYGGPKVREALESQMLK